MQDTVSVKCFLENCVTEYYVLRRVLTDGVDTTTDAMFADCIQ